MNIGERIQKLRKSAGMSQEQLSEKLGVSRQAVSKWETGESQPELDKVVKLAEIFGVTADELLGGAKRPAGVPDNMKDNTETDDGGFENGPFAPIYRLVRRKGYVAGYYFMGIGALIGLMMLVAGLSWNSMFSSMNGVFGSASMIGGTGFSDTSGFFEPAKLFVAFGVVVAVCVFTMGIIIVVKFKKNAK